MQKLDMLYEGKAKKIFRTDDSDLVVVEYKDSATAFNGEKKGTIQNKGMLNNKITTIFFELLEKNGIKTHFKRMLSDTEQLVAKLSIVPIEVVVRNVAAGSLAKRLGMEEGTLLTDTVLELYYKDDSLGDPMINYYHVKALQAATPEEISVMETMALKVNDILRAFLDKCGMDLIDFKLEFGRHNGEILLGDEISPDTCRFWDKNTGEKLDKDRFRRDLGGVEDAYQEVLRRISSVEL